MKKFLALNISLLFGAIALQAQPTNLGQFELKVTDRYKAQVKDAQKILEQPQWQDSGVAKIPVEYSIKSKMLPVRINFKPLSPARVARVEVPDLYRTYIRGGYGLYNTGLFEFYHNSKRSSKQSYGFSGQHFSTQNGVQDIAFDENVIARNALSGYYKKFYRKMTWETKADASWNRYSFYGTPRPEVWPEDTFASDMPYNWHRSYRIQTEIKEAKRKDLKALERLSFYYQHLNDNYNSRENDLGVNTDWVLPAGNTDLHLAFNSSYFRTQYDSLYSSATDSNLFTQQFLVNQLKPYIHLEKSEFIFDFGLNLYGFTRLPVDSQETVNNLYFFPEVKVRYRLVPKVLDLSAGLKGDLNQNRYRDQLAQSPFMLPGQETRASRRLNFYLQLTGILSSSTKFLVEGGIANLEDQGFVYRQPILDSAYGLELRYADAGMIYIKGELNSNIKDKLLIHASGELRSFNMSVEGPWHVPFFEGEISASYLFREKLKMGMGFDLVGPRVVFDGSFAAFGQPVIAGFVDAKLELEYRYNSRLGAFINVNNLFNQQYDWFLGYRAQSINALFGINYRF